MSRLHTKHNFYFWEKKIRDADNILLGNVEGTKLTRESVIIYIGIMDRQKVLLRSGWSSHSDGNAALGFLQHVFLPTAFYTWVDRQSDDFYFSLLPFHALKHEMIAYFDEQGTSFDEQDVLKMEEEYQRLNCIWSQNDHEQRRALQSFCEQFNITWDQDPERKLFVKVFCHCNEIVDFILENIENESIDVIEEQIDMSIEQLYFMCNNAYDEPMINKNMVELLNNKIPIWF